MFSCSDTRFVAGALIAGLIVALLVSSAGQEWLKSNTGSEGSRIFLAFIITVVIVYIVECVVAW